MIVKRSVSKILEAIIILGTLKTDRVFINIFIMYNTLLQDQQTSTFIV